MCISPSPRDVRQRLLNHAPAEHTTPLQNHYLCYVASALTSPRPTAMPSVTSLLTAIHTLGKHTPTELQPVDIGIGTWPQAPLQPGRIVAMPALPARKPYEAPQLWFFGALISASSQLPTARFAPALERIAATG